MPSVLLPVKKSIPPRATTAATAPKIDTLKVTAPSGFPVAESLSFLIPAIVEAISPGGLVPMQTMVWSVNASLAHNAVAISTTPVVI